MQNQDLETIVDQITDVTRSFVSIVTGAGIVFAAFKAVGQFLQNRQTAHHPEVIERVAAPIDFGLQLSGMPSHRLIIHSRSVQI